MTERMPAICYAGTYEREYPRNRLIIQALRDAGARVDEVHVPVFERFQNKGTAERAMIVRLVLGLILAYLRLVPIVIWKLRHRDALVVGYIGQLDMLVLAPLARLLGKTVIFNPLVTLTDTVIEDRQTVSPRSLSGRLIALVDTIGLRFAHAVITDTDENARYLRDSFRVPMSKIMVVPVGADESIFFPATAVTPEEVSKTHLDVLFIGKFIPLHGIDTIIRAEKILEDRSVPVRMELVGTGQTYAKMRALADELGVIGITWTDWIPFHDLGERLRRADVALGVFDAGPKSGRVIPNKVYQSLACGVATITRSSMAADALLTSGDNALLVAPGDPDALADAVESLIDPAKRRRVGRGGRRIYEEKASRAALARQIQPLFRIMLEQPCRP